MGGDEWELAAEKVEGDDGRGDLNTAEHVDDQGGADRGLRE